MQQKRHSQINIKGGLLALMFILMPSTHTSATQLAFANLPSTTEQHFSYRWKAFDVSYALSFSISTATFVGMPATQAAFSNAMMQREIEVNLLKYAQSVDPKTAKIRVTRQGNKLEYAVTSSSQSIGQTLMKTLQQVSRDARQNYLQTHFYTEYTSVRNPNAVKHDHARYAALSVEGLRPVVDAINAMQQNRNDPREFIQIALSWIQSIPYNTLEDRISSNGSGYVSPKDLLRQNQGDCDSKATFLAALLRAYSPRIQQKMILLPNHALLAVAISAKPNDKTLTHNGIQYVLLEAAGPAYFKIGDVSDKTLFDIRNRQYSVDLM